MQPFLTILYSTAHTMNQDHNRSSPAAQSLVYADHLYLSGLNLSWPSLIILTIFMHPNHLHSSWPSSFIIVIHPDHPHSSSYASWPSVFILIIFISSWPSSWPSAYKMTIFIHPTDWNKHLIHPDHRLPGVFMYYLGVNLKFIGCNIF
jgi:hypothetical protein